MKNFEIYRCPECGAQFEVVNGCNCDNCQPVCCGKAMKLQKANEVDAAVEKHVPVVEIVNNGILVKVGSVAHPMAEEHYIEWIEVIRGARSERCFLKPGDVPQAAFDIQFGPELKVRISCNIHGIWQNAAK